MARHPTITVYGNHGELIVDMEFGTIEARNPAGCYPGITGFNVSEAAQAFGHLWKPNTRWDIVLLGDNLDPDPFDARFNWLEVRADDLDRQASQLEKGVMRAVLAGARRRIYERDNPTVVGPIIGTPEPYGYRKGDKVLFWGTIVDGDPASEATGGWYRVSTHWNNNGLPDVQVNGRSMLGLFERNSPPRVGDMVVEPDQRPTRIRALVPELGVAVTEPDFGSLMVQKIENLKQVFEQ